MALSEKELVTKIEKILQKKFNAELSFREISAGYGIADLVIIPSSIASIGARRAPITHFGTLKFFLELKHRSYTIDNLLNVSTYHTRQQARKYVNFLVTNGYIEVDSNGLYHKIDIIDKTHPIKRIIAIEAKLTDYRNGILQAKRYQYFADQSYLAILKSAAKHIDVDQLTTSGIGLIIFDELSETVKIVKPKKGTLLKDKAYNIFAKEVMLSRIPTVSVS